MGRPRPFSRAALGQGPSHARGNQNAPPSNLCRTGPDGSELAITPQPQRQDQRQDERRERPKSSPRHPTGATSLGSAKLIYHPANENARRPVGRIENKIPLSKRRHSTVGKSIGQFTFEPTQHHTSIKFPDEPRPLVLVRAVDRESDPAL